MNSFSALALSYLLFTIISSSILYGAFKNKLDESAVYFLIAEILMALTCGVLLAENLQLIDSNYLSNSITNLASLGSEVAILFSILSLTKKRDKKLFILGIVGALILVVIIELLRGKVDLKSLVLIYTITLTSLLFANYVVCKVIASPSLANNQFMKLLKWFMLSLTGYGVLRTLAYFSNAPIIPRDTPTDLAVIIFAAYVVLGSFRYMSYIGLRITWVDPLNPSQNLLNKPLVKVIEEKDQLLQGLIASNRVIGISALASSLAHQLSQPLTTIALRADTTLRELTQADKDPRTIASLNEISHQSTKLAELVKNLRQLFSSRSDNFALINLQKTIEEIIRIVEPSLEAKKIGLIKDYESNLDIYGDSIQLQQVLINVFNNAIDAITAANNNKKLISVAVSNIGNIATITIRDNGIGIDPCELPTIFELYKTTKKSGLGIGLWLSKTIIDRHHGRIAAFNNQSGGATFKIEIPVKRVLVK